MKGLFITGTDTNVGKTYVACQITESLKKQNIKIIPRKPVETGCPLINDVLHPEDAHRLLISSGSIISLNEVCPYRFSPAISPQIAAESSAEILTLDNLISACTNNVSTDDFLLVEGAGGFYSPICSNALNSDLAIKLRLPVILVTENRLGAVNQTLLAISAIENSGLKLLTIILNKTNKLELNPLINNASEISKFTSHSVHNLSYNQKIPKSLIQKILPTL